MSMAGNNILECDTFEAHVWSSRLKRRPREKCWEKYKVQKFVFQAIFKMIWQLTLFNVILGGGTPWPCKSWYPPGYLNRKLFHNNYSIPRGHSTPTIISEDNPYRPIYNIIRTWKSRHVDRVCTKWTKVRAWNNPNAKCCMAQVAKEAKFQYHSANYFSQCWQMLKWLRFQSLKAHALCYVNEFHGFTMFHVHLCSVTGIAKASCMGCVGLRLRFLIFLLLQLLTLGRPHHCHIPFQPNAK